MKIARRKLMQMSVAAMPVLSMLRAMGQGNAPRAIATGPFQPTWESLSAQYKCLPLVSRRQIWYLGALDRTMHSRRGQNDR
jgi:hypothetical protein